MDEVNHVKMVVSFVIFCGAGLFLCLHDGYECSKNVLIRERITKILFCRLLECFIALRYQGYFTYGIRAKLKRSGLLGRKRSIMFRFN